MTTFYPSISDATLAQFQVVFTRIAADPTYIDKAPWSDEVKTFFRKYGTTPVVGDASIFDEGTDKIESIEKQIGSLLAELNRMGEQTGLDHSEKLQYLKTKAALVEKLIAMRERLFNLKEMSEFQSVIMAFLEDVCTKDQVNTLMKRLGHLPSIQEKQ